MCLVDKTTNIIQIVNQFIKYFLEVTQTGKTVNERSTDLGVT